MKPGQNLQEVRRSRAGTAKVQKTRELYNIETGAFNGEPEVKNFTLSDKRSLEDVEALVLMCDGMAWPEGNKETAYTIAAQQMIGTQGISGYYQKLKATFDTDPNMEKYLRFKHMDDATAIVLRFG